MEVATVDMIPVSALSVIVPAQFPHIVHLAVGKGSGFFEVWICNISGQKFDKIIPCDWHSQIVTGLAWAFDGKILHTCSQDNFVRCWILNGSSLCEVPIPSNNSWSEKLNRSSRRICFLLWCGSVPWKSCDYLGS
ncbi:hypothetical protein M0R45_020183 [Rubus argutus]|uniref:Uncharacterized protein n=1 Tax=Rubus argutus TaxID=59490 RepID=A0AAW1X9A6_RUBAR